MNAENMYDAWDNGDRHEIRQQFARRGGFGMTREDIENFTRQAGGFDATPEFLERFAALVAAAEREACAKVCEEPGWNAANWCAKQIRAREEKT